MCCFTHRISPRAFLQEHCMSCFNGSSLSVYLDRIRTRGISVRHIGVSCKKLVLKIFPNKVMYKPFYRFAVCFLLLCGSTNVVVKNVIRQFKYKVSVSVRNKYLFKNNPENILYIIFLNKGDVKSCMRDVQ